MNQNIFESYFITSSQIYPNNSVEIFEQNLKHIFSQHRIQKACFRDSLQIIPTELIKIFSHYCRQYNIESFINLAHIDLSIRFAKKYNFEGIHIKSHQLNEKKIIQFKTFYSAHQREEILRAYQIGIDFITISPIFTTPNKPKPLGINYLQTLPIELKKNLFALGGILTEEQIQSIKKSGVKGFASIRYFLPK